MYCSAQQLQQEAWRYRLSWWKEQDLISRPAIRDPNHDLQGVLEIGDRKDAPNLCAQSAVACSNIFFLLSLF
jgi:hypothetical protein